MRKSRGRWRRHRQRPRDEAQFQHRDAAARESPDGRGASTFASPPFQRLRDIERGHVPPIYRPTWYGKSRLRLSKHAKCEGRGPWQPAMDGNSSGLLVPSTGPPSSITKLLCGVRGSEPDLARRLNAAACLSRKLNPVYANSRLDTHFGRVTSATFLSSPHLLSLHPLHARTNVCEAAH